MLKIESGTEILIVTSSPDIGGVPTMTKFIVDVLRRAHLNPKIAFYGPFSQHPEISVRPWQLLHRTPTCFSTTAFGDVDAVGVGTYLPELEFTHYGANRIWSRVIDPYEYVVAVGGNCIPSLPLLRNRKKGFCWAATPLQEDREDRIKSLPFTRRLVASLVTPILQRIERSILRTGTVAALSEYTKHSFQKIVPDSCRDILPMPVDCDVFKPMERITQANRIGFTGRFSDPRKQTHLLLEAFAISRRSLPNLKLQLIGDTLSPQLASVVQKLNLGEHVETIRYINRSELPRYLNQLDLFVIPSFQEGLCIAGIEAMSCGCPVVSTSCGGPSEYVIENQTGVICNHTPESMATAITSTLSDTGRWKRMSAAATKKAQTMYSYSVAESKFWQIMQSSCERLT